MKKLLSLVSVFLLGFSALGEGNIDAIELQLDVRLKGNQRDTTTIDLLKELSHHYFSTQPLKGIEYAQLAMTIAKENNDAEKKGDIFNYFGNFYRDQGLLDLALEAHLNSLEISEQIGDTVRLVYALNDLGNIYYDQKNWETALKHYARAADLSKHIGSNDALPVSYNNIGLVMHSMGDYEMAFCYFAKALKYREMQNKPELIGHSFNYIGMVYRSQGDFRLATEYFGKALKQFKEINNEMRIGDTYMNIGINYAMKEDYETAMACFEKAQSYYENVNHKIELTNCFKIRAKYELESGKISEAQKDLLQALALCDENGFRGVKQKVLYLLSQAEEGLGNYKTALEYYQAYTELKDSLSSNEVANKTARMEAAYSFRQKEKEMVLAQKESEVREEKLIAQRLRLKFFITILSGALVVSLLIVALRLKPKQRKKLVTEFKTKVAGLLH